MAYESCKDSSETQVLRSSVSAIGLMAVLIPIPACAMASVSVRSFFVVPGKHLRAYFIAFPGRYLTSILFAHHLYTISEPMLFFWSTIDQGARFRLVEQSLDVLLAPVLPVADRDGATRAQDHCPEERSPHIYAEIEALRPEPVFLLVFHGGTFLFCRQVSVSEGRHPHYPAIVWHIPISRFRTDHHPLAATPPGPSQEAGVHGCPVKVSQQLFSGVIYKVRESAGTSLSKTPKLEEVPRGLSLTVMG